MATVYTERLARANFTSSLVDIATCPAGHRWVIRDIVLSNGFSTPGPVSVLINTGSGHLAVFVGEVPGSQTQHLELRQVINEGESLSITSTASGLSLVVTGYAFLL